MELKPEESQWNPPKDFSNKDFYKHLCSEPLACLQWIVDVCDIKIPHFIALCYLNISLHFLQNDNFVLFLQTFLLFDQFFGNLDASDNSTICGNLESILDLLEIQSNSELRNPEEDKEIRAHCLQAYQNLDKHIKSQSPPNANSSLIVLVYFHVLLFIGLEVNNIKRFCDVVKNCVKIPIRFLKEE